MPAADEVVGVERAARPAVARFGNADALGCGPSALGCAGALLLVLGVLVARTGHYAPLERLSGGVLLGGCAATALLALLRRRLGRSHVLRAELVDAPDRLVLMTDHGPSGLLLDRVHAVDDAPGGGLRLRLGPRPSREDPTLPAGGDAAREALLAALARHGVAPGRPRATPPPPLPPALLELDGGQGCVEHVVLLVTVTLLLALWLAGSVPELEPLRPMGRALGEAPLFALLLLVPWVAVAVSLEGRRGRTTLRTDRVEVAHGAIAWEDVLGHTGGGRREVRLVLRPGPLRLLGRVATPDAAGRAALLELLRGRGIPRVAPDAPTPAIGQRPAPPPLVSLRGWQLPGKVDPAGLAAGLVFAGSVLLLVGGLVMSRWAFLPRPGLLGVVVVLAGGAVGAALTRRWLLPRSGTAELHAGRVSVRRGAEAATVFFSDLLAFDDGSTDVVQLIVRPPARGWRRLRGARRVGVPTPDEATRLALLGALTEAGVPRLDSEPVPRPPPEPLLVARGRRRWPEAALWAATALLAVAAGATEGLVQGAAIAGLCMSGSAALLAMAVVAPRRGTTTFFADRVERGGRAWAWDDVLGFSLQPGHVLLVVRPTTLSDAEPAPSIPAPDAAALDAARALLLARGIPQVDG